MSSLQVLIFSNPSFLFPSAAVTCLFSLVCALVLAFFDKRAERILDKEEGRTGRNGRIRSPLIFCGVYTPLCQPHLSKYVCCFPKLPSATAAPCWFLSSSVLILGCVFFIWVLFVHLSEKPIPFLVQVFNSTIRPANWSGGVFALAIRWGDQADWCERLPPFPVAHLPHLRGLLRCRLPLYWTGAVSAVSLSAHTRTVDIFACWLFVIQIALHS